MNTAMPANVVDRPVTTLRFRPADEPNGVTYKTMLIEAQLELANAERTIDRITSLLHTERNKRRRVKDAQRSLQAAYNEKLRLLDSYYAEVGYWRDKYMSLAEKHGEAV